MRQRFTRTVAGLTAAALAASGAAGAAVVGASSAAAEDSVLLENDFESSADPWTPRGPVTLEITDDARTGSGALSVTGRTGEWNGPATDATALLTEGGVHQIEAWVKLPAGATDPTDIHFTVQETPAGGGDDAYTWVGGAVTATADEWVQVGGSYTMPEDLSAAQLYLEAAPVGDVHPDFLVDDVLITGQEVDGSVPDGFVPGGAVSPTTTPVAAAQAGSDGAPVAALTFDDGPNPGTTPALLDFLAANDLHATFCVIGQNVQADGGAEILRRIAADGHTLCNHSTGYADMGSMTPEQAQADMIANLDIIRDALGDPQAKVPFWRAPNGSWGSTPGVAVTLGMQPLAVTNTIADWETQDEATLTENLRAALTDGELVLVHDGGGDRAGSLAATETVVTESLAEGWEFTLPAGTPPPSGPVLTTDFSDGLDGWGPRTGDETEPTVAITTDDAASGTSSAVVTDRDSQGDGIGRDVSDVLEPGVAYEFTAQVRFAAGQEPDAVWLSLASTADGSTSYATLAQWSDVTADGWTEVTASFQAPAGSEQFLYLETDYNNSNTSDLLVDDITLSVPEPPVVQDLEPIQDTVPFPAGVAIDSRETSGAAADLLLRHFGQITAENHMKPEAWYDDEGTFRPHPEAVALMDFAAEHDLAMYGHVLTWHSQTPEWFFTDDAGEPLTDSAADQQVLRDRLRTHIDAVVDWLATYGEFGGDNPVTAFDVVNEVVSDGATDDGLRRSEWYRILGEEFIDLSFEYADSAFNEVHAAEGADRPVTLFINDYNTEQGAKQDRYRALVERLLERGVPLDGVGHQFHVSLAMPISALETAIDRFTDLPVTQAVTELDVTTGTPVTEAKLIDQGYYYRDAFRLFRDRADSLYSVTVWGLTDGRSWRADNGAPLVFDDAFQAKPAYDGVVDGDLAAQQRAADVFAGDVPLDGDAAASPQWERLPQHAVSASGEQAAGFQLRWAPDHLTAYVTVDDVSPEATDTVTFELDGATAVVQRDGTVTGEGVTAEVTETDAGYDVVAHLPLEAAAEGDTLGLDVRVSDGGTTAGWNSPGALGTLTLREPLSFVEVPEATTTPIVDGEIDAAWSDADAVTTEHRVEGTDGAVGTFRTLWDGDTLYVLAEIPDPVVDVSGSDPWIQDSVEIFLDTGNTKNGAYEDDDTQIRISAENATSFGTGDADAQAERLESAVALTAGGYVVEAAIDLLGQGGAGTFHGLDFQVNDAADGARQSVTTWADPTGTGYQYTNRWGVAELLAPSAPAWTEGQVYTAGDEVSHDGALYRATWWTTQTPGDSPWGSWQEIATADDGTAVWTPSRIFTAGDVVTHDGDTYEAQWWTRNQEPGGEHGPWEVTG